MRAYSTRTKVAAIASSAALAGLGFAGLAGAGSAMADCTPSANTACAGVNVSIPANAITLTLSTSAITLNGSGLAYNGSPVEDWTVNTNDVNGYHVAVLGDGSPASTALVNNTNPSDTIPDSDMTIQTTVNAGTTTSSSPNSGNEYTTSGPSLAAGDVGADLWLLRLPGPQSPASGGYAQQFDYEAIQQ